MRMRPSADQRAPGIYQTYDPVVIPPMSLANTRIAGFVGITQKGPMNEPTRLGNWDEFLEIFGYSQDSYTSDSVYGFFKNGGTDCWVVRVAHNPANRPNSLIVALKGAQPELKDKFLANMSSRAAESLKEDLESRGPMRLSEVEAQQKEILAIVRRLAAIEHAVVPHDPHATQSRTVGDRELVLEALSGGMVAPGNQQDQIARRQDGVEKIPLEDAVGARIQPHQLRAIRRIAGILELGWTLHRDQRDGGPFADLGLVQALLDDRLALRYFGVAGNLADP